MTRVFERQTVEDSAAGPDDGERVVNADGPRVTLEHLSEVRLAQPSVDALADLDADRLRNR